MSNDFFLFLAIAAKIVSILRNLLFTFNYLHSTIYIQHKYLLIQVVTHRPLAGYRFFRASEAAKSALSRRQCKGL
jgi:hypothetical protein